MEKPRDYSSIQSNFTYPISGFKKIIDGDTFDCWLDLGFDITILVRVRMAGIDTPESRTSDLEEKYYGLLAKSELSKWVYPDLKQQQKEGFSYFIKCEERDSRGKYGRVLGELWATNVETGEEVNINEWMCLNYFAVPYDGGKSDNWGINREHLFNRNELHKIGINPYYED